jgi:hypothetical protein
MSKSFKARVLIEKIASQSSGAVSSAADDLKRAFEEQMEALRNWRPEPPPSKKIPLPPTTSIWSSGPLKSKTAWLDVEKPEMQRRFQACADRHEFNIRPGYQGGYVGRLQVNLCFVMAFIAVLDDQERQLDYTIVLLDWISSDNSRNSDGFYGQNTSKLISDFKTINDIFTYGTKKIDNITGINTIRALDLYYSIGFES